MQYRDLPYDVVLPGHGVPGDKSLYDAMSDYLDFAEVALGDAATAAAFKQTLLQRFPDHGGGKVLDHQLRFLFR
jgi:hypothetical protein